MKPVRFMRDKREKKNVKKILLFILSAVIIVGIIIGAIFLIRGCVLSIGSAIKGNDDKTKYFAVNNGDNISMTVQVGDMCILTVSDDLDKSKIEYVSSDEEILRVDAGGRVDALKEGEASISITGPDLNSGCDFVIEKASPVKESSEITSAIIANQDYLNHNLNSGISDYPYLIQVNRKTNVVTVFTFDEKGEYTVPVRSMICSCGTGGSDETPTGEYAIEYKARWNALFGDCYGQYITGFNGDILFHSVPYYTEDAADLEIEEYNKLGQNASQGCVRMEVSDAKWIYDNCDMNTVVRVVDKGEDVDVLGKPIAIKIPKDKEAWDPTDPDTKNPYLKSAPSISGVEDKEIKKGEEYDVRDGLVATDTCGNNITDDVQITGNVITEKPGIYYVTYYLSDGVGKKAEKTITITVK